MSSPLTLVPPLAITDAILDYTDVPESVYPAWSNVVTYAEDARAYLDHTVYQSVQAGNLNHPPATSPDWWEKVGPTNRWALFDGYNDTQTAKANAMTYRLKPVGPITALAVLNAAGCNTTRVRASHPTYGDLYDRAFPMASLPTTGGWWAWFFGERVAPDVMVATDLPALPGCTFTVDFAGTTALAIGVLLVGQQKRIGIGVKVGARVGIDDRSDIIEGDFGQTTFVQRTFNKRCSLEVPIEGNKSDAAIKLLESRRATPTLYIGARGRSSMVIFGFYKSFEVVHAYEDLSECSIEIKGMT